MYSVLVTATRPQFIVRYPELDVLRGIAVLLMVLYHTAFDIEFFFGIPLLTSAPWTWWIVGKAAAILFLILVGICFTISWSRTPLEHQWDKQWIRAIKITAGGLIVTVGTLIFIPEAYVRFGILHLIGISALLQPLFVKMYTYWLLLIGLLWMSAGMYVQTLSSSATLLLPLGIRSTEFTTVDYFPLFPWFGVVLCGMVCGTILYVPQQHARIRSIPLPLPSWLRWCGRYALWIYMLHQPILLSILWLLIHIL